MIQTRGAGKHLVPKKAKYSEEELVERLEFWEYPNAGLKMVRVTVIFKFSGPEAKI